MRMSKLLLCVLGVALMILAACAQQPGTPEKDFAGKASGVVGDTSVVLSNDFCKFAPDSTSKSRCTQDTNREPRLSEFDVYLVNEQGQTTQSGRGDIADVEFLSYTLVKEFTNNPDEPGFDSTQPQCQVTGLTTYVHPTADLDGSGTADNLNGDGDNMNADNIHNTIRVRIAKPLASARFTKYILYKKMYYTNGVPGSPRTLVQKMMVTTTPATGQIKTAAYSGVGSSRTTLAALGNINTLLNANNNLQFFDITGASAGQYVELTIPIGLKAGENKLSTTSRTDGPIDTNDIANPWRVEGPTYVLLYTCACNGVECQSTSKWTCNPAYATTTGLDRTELVVPGGVPEKGMDIGRWNMEWAPVRALPGEDLDDICIAAPI